MVESVGSNMDQLRANETAREARGTVEAEISALRSEVASIRSMLSQAGAQTLDKVTQGAERAADYVQEEALSVAGAIREHPATATTLMTLIGGIGFAIGYLVASAQADQKQAWYRRYY
ncbi:hypothetical protein [Rhizobium sp. SSA_523]|uniref:hypothetical protein n=1 Tax=Rhizobium sp. SSA_523 TaxID=2952477 RepID=UPI002091E249|nr:hypothetical protein [Rhizobium sp. SSA_523]MCO5732845.1 hypothetical protein [Rhizobium sp. SSA_523]WKC23538.1 hypothetical protein QTJ18_22525 [Rhizobium sp. SSA_523]